MKKLKYIKLFESFSKNRELSLPDKSGKGIHVGDHVIMPDPNANDMWIYGEFSAYVKEIDVDNGYIITEDGDGDCWTVKAVRVELEE